MLHVGRWIVRADPEAGLEMFTGMKPPLAPEVALPILTSEAPSLCAPYLQAALAANTAAPEVFHTELALIYLRSALEQHKPGSTPREERPSGGHFMIQRHASPLSSEGCVAIVATPLHLGSCRASWG